MENKVFVLYPSDCESVEKLETLLNDGWLIVRADSQAASTGGTYSAYGNIVYVLEKHEDLPF